MKIFVKLIMNQLSLKEPEIISWLRLNSQSWKIIDGINIIILCIMFVTWIQKSLRTILRELEFRDYQAKMGQCDLLHCFMFHDKNLGYSVHTCKKCYDPICVHYHITCSWSVFWKPHLRPQLELAVWKVTLQPLYSKIHAGWRHHWTPRYPPLLLSYSSHSPASPSTPISSPD